MTQTSANIAAVSATLIRAALADLLVSSVPSLDKGARELRAGALARLRETANQLDAYAAGVEAQSSDFVRDVQGLSVARANRWHGGDFRQWSGLEWAGAMCGEAGEAANVAKKLRRVELEIDGNAKSERPLDVGELRGKLAGECADVFLYLVLLAARYDIDLQTAIVDTFNAKSREMGFPETIVSAEART